MAKAAKVDPAHLKALLNKASGTPLNCAIGFAEDGSAVIKLDRAKQPRAVLKLLEDEHGALKNSRWGTATVNPEEDAKLVILHLNKAMSGAAAKLKKTLKGTGFSKVRIHLEDGSVAEAAEEDEEDVVAGAAKAAPFDAKALTHHLTDLVKRMAPHMAGDAAMAKELKTLAMDAQAKLKASHPDTAHVLSRIEGILAHGGKAVHEEAGKLHPVSAKAGKAKLVWGAALKKIHADVAAAKTEITGAIGHTELASEVHDTFRTKVEPSLAVLDTSLHHALEQAEKATVPAERERAVAEAHKIIKAFQQHAATDKVIQQLDRNPFAPVSIGKTLNTTLTALSAAIG